MSEEAFDIFFLLGPKPFAGKAGDVDVELTFPIGFKREELSRYALSQGCPKERYALNRSCGLDAIVFFKKSTQSAPFLSGSIRDSGNLAWPRPYSITSIVPRNGCLPVSI